MPTDPTDFTKIDAAYIGAIVGACAALVGSIANIIISCLNRKSDHRKHIKELAVTLAIEQWRYKKEFAADINVRGASDPTLSQYQKPNLGPGEIQDYVAAMVKTLNGIK